MGRALLWVSFGLIVMLMLPPLAVAAAPEVGVCIYNGEDTFISSLLKTIEVQAQGLVNLSIRDAANDQNRQNDQVESLLAQGMDALIVNPVDRTSAVYLIKMAARYNTPIVLINREPLPEDLALYDKAYYVGIDPKEQGILSGQIAAHFFTTVPGADRNGDGVLQIVILKGEPGHQDAELRTQYAVKAIQGERVKVEKLAEDTALWERSLGQERMAGLLSTFGDRIECVLSNNDDMALGAIDALKAAGYFAGGGKTMPVIGIDATAPALEARAQGTLYGTVMNDAEGQARAAIELALLLAQGGTPTEANFAYAMVGKVVYIPSKIIMATEEGR